MTPTTPTAPSILKSLRALTPTRACTFDEALNVTERQATRLTELIGNLNPDCDGIDLSHINGLPRIRVVFEALPVSGMSHWNGREWIIAIAQGDSPARQRFTLLHEFKHVIDHGQADRLYGGTRARTPGEQAEAAADYFAGCALVPRRELKSAWGRRMQRAADLAAHFGVSEQAIRVRLAQTGLTARATKRPRPAAPDPSAPHAGRPSASPSPDPELHEGATREH